MNKSVLHAENSSNKFYGSGRPSICPVIDFVDDIGTFLALSPKTFLIIIALVLSLNSVEVPCALI